MQDAPRAKLLEEAQGSEFRSNIPYLEISGPVRVMLGPFDLNLNRFQKVRCLGALHGSYARSSFRCRPGVGKAAETATTAEASKLIVCHVKQQLGNLVGMLTYVHMKCLGQMML